MDVFTKWNVLVDIDFAISNVYEEMRIQDCESASALEVMRV